MRSSERKMPNTAEFTRFTNAMRHIVSVSKDELLRREEAYKKQAALNPKKRGPKPKKKTKPSGPGPAA